MTEAVLPDERQLLVAVRYQLQSYLRTYRFFAMVGIVLALGTIVFSVFAYLQGNGTIRLTSDSSAFLAGPGGPGVLGFLATIVYFSAALLGGDAISTDFGARTGYYTLVLPIRRRILLLGRYIAAVLTTFLIALLYYIFAIAMDLYFTGGLPVGPVIESMLVALLFSAAAVALAFFFSSLVKTPALSILLTVLMFFVILPIITGVVSAIANIEPWFALNYAEVAITEPIVSLPHRLEGPLAAYQPYLWEGLVIMAAYLVVCLLLSYVIYEFKESTG
ncbi:MAG: ABC transporter permease [Thermoplasmata archaeon]|nr:ABC transporter permease [Thermoplasmata archaeon]